MSDRRRTYLNNLVENMTYLGSYSPNSGSIEINDSNRHYINLASNIPSQFNRLMYISDSMLHNNDGSSNLGYKFKSISYSIISNNSGISSSSNYNPYGPITYLNFSIRASANSSISMVIYGLEYKENSLKLFFQVTGLSNNTIVSIYYDVLKGFDLIGINE